MSSPFASTDRRVAAALAAFFALAIGCKTGAAAGAVLQIQAPTEDADADVWVDGHYVGRVDALGRGKLPPIRLAPGVHRVEVRKPGRFPVQRTVRIEKGGPGEVVVSAELLEDPQ